MATKVQKNPVQKKSNSKLTKAQKREKFENSEYFKQVLAPNKAIKLESKTLNGAMKLAQTMLAGKTEFKDVSEKLASVNYGKLKKACRKSKSGNYCPFYVLQAVRKLG